MSKKKNKYRVRKVQQKEMIPTAINIMATSSNVNPGRILSVANTINMAIMVHSTKIASKLIYGYLSFDNKPRVG